MMYGVLAVKNKHLGNVRVRCQVVHSLHIFIRIGRVGQTQFVNILFYLQLCSFKKQLKIYILIFIYLFTFSS